jgi:hypothetical protein
MKSQIMSSFVSSYPDSGSPGDFAVLEEWVVGSIGIRNQVLRHALGEVGMSPLACCTMKPSG